MSLEFNPSAPVSETHSRRSHIRKAQGQIRRTAESNTRSKRSTVAVPFLCFRGSTIGRPFHYQSQSFDTLFLSTASSLLPLIARYPDSDLCFPGRCKMRCIRSLTAGWLQPQPFKSLLLSRLPLCHCMLADVCYQDGYHGESLGRWIGVKLPHRCHRLLGDVCSATAILQRPLVMSFYKPFHDPLTMGLCPLVLRLWSTRQAFCAPRITSFGHTIKVFLSSVYRVA